MPAFFHSLLVYYSQSFSFCFVLFCFVLFWLCLTRHALKYCNRLFFQKAGEKYPDVIADKVVMSFACGRSVPDSLVDDKYRNSHGQLLAPCLFLHRSIVPTLVLCLCTEAHSIRTDAKRPVTSGANSLTPALIPLPLIPLQCSPCAPAVLPVERETMHHLKHKKTVANVRFHHPILPICLNAVHLYGIACIPGKILPVSSPFLFLSVFLLSLSLLSVLSLHL
jgi:hypothetical protein